MCVFSVWLIDSRLITAAANRTMRHGVVIGAPSITTACVDSMADAIRQNQQHDAVGSTCSRTVDTNIGCLLGRLSMIRGESPDAFVYPRINRLEMPGTEPELLRPGEPTPITLSVVKYLTVMLHKYASREGGVWSFSLCESRAPKQTSVRKKMHQQKNSECHKAGSRGGCT